ncbi:MAG: ATPase, T2SS/T4P/T4SS family [Acidobacteriaceae bacterium]
MSFEVILPFLKPIRHLLEAETVSEIMVNPDSSVWIEEDARMQLLSGIRFDDGTLLTGLEVIANKFGKKLDADSPILNLRLPDGSRMAALIPPVVHPAPMMTIRKFTSRGFTMSDLIEKKMLTDVQAATLTEAVQRGGNLLIAGGTNTGKTTLLNVLADTIPNTERILVIEDTAELHIRKPHVVSAEAQLDTHKSLLTFEDLLKAVLRHRPDRILIGEVRGPEARTLLDAMNTGHRGMLATIHASSAEDAFYRLATLAMRGNGNLQLQTVFLEIQRCLDLVVYVARRHGLRCIEEIYPTSSQTGGADESRNSRSTSNSPPRSR